MPVTVNIQDAKTHLSRLVDRAAGGEEIVVARHGRPVARLVALEPPRAPRRGGWAAGQVRVGEDFDAPLPADLQVAFDGTG